MQNQDGSISTPSSLLVDDYQSPRLRAPDPLLCKSTFWRIDTLLVTNYRAQGVTNSGNA